MFDQAQSDDVSTEGLGKEFQAELARRIEVVQERVERGRSAAGSQLNGDHERDIGASLSNLARFDVEIGLIGPTGSGKTTLLNSTAMTVVGEDLLPTGAGATSALCTELRHGPQRRFLLLRESGVEEEISLTEVRALRLETDDGQLLLRRAKRAAQDDPAVRLICEGVLPATFRGIHLSDSRGTFDGGSGTAAALRAARGWHAVVVVERDRAGGVGRESMMDVVRRAAPTEKELFVVVNQQYSKPPSLRYQADIYQTYIHGTGRGPRWTPDTDLADWGIFFVNAMEALEARRSGDNTHLEASGLPAFERAVPRRILDSRWKVQVRPWLADLRNVFDGLRGAVLRETDRLRADLAAVTIASAADLAEIEARKAALRAARRHVDGLADEVTALVEREFRTLIAASQEDVAKDLDAAMLSNASGMKILGLIKAQNREALGAEVAAVISSSLQRRIERWSSSEEGAARAMRPLVEAAIETTVGELAAASVVLEQAILRRTTQADTEMAELRLAELRRVWQAKLSQAFNIAAGKVVDNLPSGASPVIVGAGIGAGLGASLVMALSHALGSAIGLKVKAAIAAALLKATVLKSLMTKLSIAIAGLMISGPVGWAIALMAALGGGAYAASKLSGEVKKAAKQAFEENASALADGLWDEVKPTVRAEAAHVGATLGHHIDALITALDDRRDAVIGQAQSETQRLGTEISERAAAGVRLLDVVDEFDLDLVGRESAAAA